MTGLVGRLVFFSVKISPPFPSKIKNRSGVGTTGLSSSRSWFESLSRQFFYDSTDSCQEPHSNSSHGTHRSVPLNIFFRTVRQKFSDRKTWYHRRKRKAQSGSRTFFLVLWDKKLRQNCYAFQVRVAPPPSPTFAWNFSIPSPFRNTVVSH